MSEQNIENTLGEKPHEMNTAAFDGRTSSCNEKVGEDQMFEKFLEDSEMEGDKELFNDFDSSKVTRVLKVFLSKS
jgi:hypothetical protein